MYGYHHWKVIFPHPRWNIPEHIRDPVFALFDIIDFHKVFFAVAATVLAIACVRHRPRWIGGLLLIRAVLMVFVTAFFRDVCPNQVTGGFQSLQSLHH